MGDYCNTHYYDGKIATEFIKEPDVAFLEHESDVAVLRTKLVNPLAINVLNVMLNDWGTDANYDPTNNIRVEPLLIKCLDFVDNPDFVSLFETQLVDMLTGFCSQGRTHRLTDLVRVFA
jgi:hypothetical protein